MVCRACNPPTPVVTLSNSGDYTLLGGKGLRTALVTEKGIGVTLGEETVSWCNLVPSLFFPSLMDRLFPLVLKQTSVPFTI